MRIPCVAIQPGMTVQWGGQSLTVASLVWIHNGGGILTFTNGHQTSVNKVGFIDLHR